VKVEADNNILPLILTDVQNNVLTIKQKENTSISKMSKINVYVTFVDLAELRTEGVGMVKSGNKLHFNDLTLDLKGVGATKLDLDVVRLNIHSEIVGALLLSGKAGEVTIKHKGIGAIEAFGLKAEKLSLESDGIGKAEIFASKELSIDTKGMGGVEYKGNPPTKSFHSEGLGKIESKD
jgi:putative autotransporter adhesin-like protein